MPKPLTDEYGVIAEAYAILPSTDLKLALLKTLSEIEDNQRWKKQDWAHARVHKMSGIKPTIFRADITKSSGWRIHLQLHGGFVHIIFMSSGGDHDRGGRLAKQYRGRMKS